MDPRDQLDLQELLDLKVQVLKMEVKESEELLDPLDH